MFRSCFCRRKEQRIFIFVLITKFCSTKNRFLYNKLYNIITYNSKQLNSNNSVVKEC